MNAHFSIPFRPPAQERALKPGDSFKECAECSEMIVVPAGRFLMGSPAGQGTVREHPPHEVTIAPFAVAKFAVTFNEWDACAGHGPCRRDVDDNGWGRGQRPVVDVTWGDIEAYIGWLSSIASKPYRLLSEAEREYATRAGTQTAYPWGDDIKLNGNPMANCDGCGSKWNGDQTAPVGSFPANGFGLYDMVGNTFEWTADCWNPNYKGAPTDGTPWMRGDCNRHVVRGGMDSVERRADLPGDQFSNLGFRVARPLSP